VDLFELRRSKRDLILRAAKTHGARKVRVFGSVARGNSSTVSDLLQVWVLHHLQIIGEAARVLSGEFRERYPNPVWSEATGLRHIVVHQILAVEASE
jgi:uncharacterized protein with HEPN domain